MTDDLQDKLYMDMQQERAEERETAAMVERLQINNSEAALRHLSETIKDRDELRGELRKAQAALVEFWKIANYSCRITFGGRDNWEFREAYAVHLKAVEAARKATHANP